VRDDGDVDDPERVGGTGGTGFRPARWAWTTITAVVLLVLQGFAVLGLGIDVANREMGSVEALSHPVVLETFERGFAIALVPVILLAVVVLVLGLACALFHVPDAQGSRLSVETALWVLGGALLVASVWTRHVPRAWWPRGEVSG
jgi:hypothetical protein